MVVDCRHVHFTWTASLTPTIVKYCIVRNFGAPRSRTTCIAVPALGLTVDTLPGQSFDYTIYALDSNGTTSDPVGPVTLQTPFCPCVP